MSHASGGGGRTAGLKELVTTFEKRLILSALATAGGNQRSAARLLGVGATTLNEKMRRLGIRGQGASTPTHASEKAAAAREGISAKLHWTGKARPGSTLEVREWSGQVNIKRVAGSQIEIYAIRRGDRLPFSTVEVSITEHSGGVTVRSITPAGHRWLGTGAGRPMDDADVQVELVAIVPRDVRVLSGTVDDGSAEESEATA